MTTALLALALACVAVDGDTLRCGRERVRLLAIDAPEMPGHCRSGRACVPGDPYAAKRSLAQAMRAGPITLRRVKLDRYGRTVALVWAGRVNLSCYMLAHGAAYVPAWDDGGLVARGCA